MKVSKWVDMGQEVEIEIGIEDVRIAMCEAFHVVTRDNLGEPGPANGEVMRKAFNNLAGRFLRAPFTDEQITQLKPEPREVWAEFLNEESSRLGGIPP